MIVKHFYDKNGDIREVIEHFDDGVLYALGFIEGFVTVTYDKAGRLTGWKPAKGVKKSSEKAFLKYKYSVENPVLEVKR